MYKHYDNLTTEEVESLVELSKEVKFKDSGGTRVRMGANGSNALSIYNYSKWFTWKHKQREVFKAAFPENSKDSIVQGWFLKLPAYKGFLDLQDTWVDNPMSGRVIATALQDQTIYIENTAIDVKKGEQIGFSLCSLHEIKPSDKGQLWACVMIRCCHTKISG